MITHDRDRDDRHQERMAQTHGLHTHSPWDSKRRQEDDVDMTNGWGERILPVRHREPTCMAAGSVLANSRVTQHEPPGSRDAAILHFFQ